jgi:hypothetical protein
MPGGQRDLFLLLASIDSTASYQLISVASHVKRRSSLLCNRTTRAFTASPVAPHVSSISRSCIMCASYMSMGVSNANRSAALNDRNTLNRSLFRAEHRATGRKDSHRQAIQTDSSQASETEEGKEPKANRHKTPSSTRTSFCSGL